MSTLALSLLGVLAAPAADGLPPAPDPVQPQGIPLHATPDPFGSEREAVDEDDGKFEIGGFMKRPPPPPPTSEAPVEPDASRLVWGFHRPVAPWKRRGLIASAAIMGTGLVTLAVVRPRWRRAEQDVLNRADEIDLHQAYIPQNSMDLCRANVTSHSGSQLEVVDMELAHSCVRLRRGVALDRAAVAVSLVGALSVVTFGVLHAVRRVPARRVEARSDGFAVRF